jgi:hypothetical protein
MLRRVALVKTDVSEELSASFIKVTRIGELGTTLKNGVFWVVTPCGSCKNRRFGVPPNRRFVQVPHGVTIQKTPFFIVTAVKKLKSYIGTTLAVTSNRRTLRRNTNLKSYKINHLDTVTVIRRWEVSSDKQQVTTICNQLLVSPTLPSPNIMCLQQEWLFGYRHELWPMF